MAESSSQSSSSSSSSSPRTGSGGQNSSHTELEERQNQQREEREHRELEQEHERRENKIEDERRGERGLTREANVMTKPGLAGQASGGGKQKIRATAQDNILEPDAMRGSEHLLRDMDIENEDDARREAMGQTDQQPRQSFRTNN